MNYPIPQPLQQEHEALHAELRNATQAGGAVGDAARALAKLMHPHFVKEDEFALPPLGLLQPLTQGAVTAEMADVLKLTDRLAAELPIMLAEHKTIVAALERLIGQARRTHRHRAVRTQVDATRADRGAGDVSGGAVGGPFRAPTPGRGGAFAGSVMGAYRQGGAAK